MIQISLTAGILILFILAERIVLLCRIPKKVFLILWGIVLFRLLLPVSISLPQKQAAWIMTERQNIEDQNAADPAENMAGGMMEPVQEKETLRWKSRKVLDIVGHVYFKFEWLWKRLYAAGAVLVLLVFLFCYLRSRRWLDEALPLKDEEIQKVWDRCKVIAREVPIFVSDQIFTPMTYGVLHPKVVLPKRSVCDQNLEYILTHESIHIRRMDAVWKFLILVATILHWWNPLVWVMMILANRDLEIACDEEVLSLWGAQRRTSYAMALIQLAEQKNSISPLASGFGKSAIQERIVAIMKYKKKSAAGILAGVCMILSSLTVFVVEIKEISDSAIESEKQDDMEIYFMPETEDVFYRLEEYNSIFHQETE